MANRSLVFGLITVQFLLIAFTLYKVMGGQPSSSASSAETASLPAALGNGEGSLRIAYINNDSLIAGYLYQQELRASLERQAKAFESDLQRKSKVFEENYAILEQQAANLTDAQLQMAQAELMQKQQELIQYRDEKAQQLAEEEARLTQELKKDLDAVVTQLREDQNIDFVFSLDPSSILMYANSAFDITPLVLEKLNAGHEARQQSR